MYPVERKSKSGVRMKNIETFFQTHPVFTLGQFQEMVGGQATASTIRTRIKYHLSRGRLKLVEKGVYAVVPPGIETRRSVPDRFLVAAALREDAVLAYHSALELLGYGHSTYRDTFYFTARRRKDLVLAGGRIRAFLHPKQIREKGEERYGVEMRERLGVKIQVTGPESDRVPPGVEKGFPISPYCAAVRRSRFMAEISVGALHLSTDRPGVISPNPPSDASDASPRAYGE